MKDKARFNQIKETLLKTGHDEQVDDCSIINIYKN